MSCYQYTGPGSADAGLLVVLSQVLSKPRLDDSSGSSRQRMALCFCSRSPSAKQASQCATRQDHRPLRQAKRPSESSKQAQRAEARGSPCELYPALTPGVSVRLQAARARLAAKWEYYRRPRMRQLHRLIGEARGQVRPEKPSWWLLAAALGCLHLSGMGRTALHRVPDGGTSGGRTSTEPRQPS